MKQFSTFDNLADRRELMILFQQLGDGLPVAQARKLRADWLKRLISKSTGRLAAAPVDVDPLQCDPVGAYHLFVQIVGVLGVSIDDAAVSLDRYVSKGSWRRET